MDIPVNQEAAQTESKRCKGTKKNGQPCGAPVLTPGGYCFMHDPALASKRLAAWQKGGKNSSRAARLDKLLPTRLKPVYSLLERSMSDVYKGILQPSKGTAIAALARACVAVLEAGELEDRVREIEEKVGGNK